MVSKPFFLAFVSDPVNRGKKAVATAGAEVVDETVRLWGAGTLAEHRGRGAYSALVVERCRLAHALGATLALTKANAATSAPLLRNAGFRPVASERRHALQIPQPKTAPRPAPWITGKGIPSTTMNLDHRFM